MYLDGVAQTTSGSGTINTSGANIAVGTIPGAVNNANYTGALDEMRISNIVRSPDWIKTEYNNQSSPDKATYGSSGFYTVGAATTP